MAELKAGAGAERSSAAPFAVQAPALSLPKGGGAIRGIGEKFSANPVTGTGSMSVPIATSPGRSGFGPQLSLAYDSGTGNGPFGFGWGLSLPSVTRKTQKGLPQYLDESDVFILSGADDLVPVFRQDGTHAWVRTADGNYVVHEDVLDGYLVRRYRPRVEGLFARIERWTNLSDADDVHWRSISKDNVLTLYGRDSNSRITDPEDEARIFSWLISETRDDKGNGTLYQYKSEDGVGVDLTRVCERNRGPIEDARRTANRYLKRIHYGNRTPLLDAAGLRPRFVDRLQIETQIANGNWMFEVVFDYGEHDLDVPKPMDNGPWSYRPDPFSHYRSGFEIRTTRRCRRVLMFHHFESEEGVGRDCLVRSTDFTFSDDRARADANHPVYSFVQGVTQTGYRRSGNGYLKRSLPPVEFEYAQPKIEDAVHDVDPESLENLPAGVDGAGYRWTDLHGEGIPGILSEQAGAWHYKRNLSPISTHLVEFAPVEPVTTKPNLALVGGAAHFMDLAGDGTPDVVVLDGPTPGFYEHDDAESWLPFQSFTSQLNRDTRDPNLRFIDLDGDGIADILITEDEAIVWHASLGKNGYGPARRIAHALDEDKGPRLILADGTASVYLADLSGDGLSDLVRIRNGEVCYWPNLGYGRFGAKVSMDGAPTFDNPDQFDQKRLRLADIDGSGTTDLIYLHRNGVCLYFNQSGNGWTNAERLLVAPRTDEVASIAPADLRGNGTTCLVWSSPLPGDARLTMRYVALMGDTKPHLLIKTTNNLGAETRARYAPSTKFYLQDRRDGKPWITRLPFPVHVVERVETFDYISRNRFVTRYAYHHGYYDHEEREFHGFGRVDQWDTEQFASLSNSTSFPVGDNVAAESHVPPVLTKTWFHTGVYIERDHVLDYSAGFLTKSDAGEYFREPGLTNAEARDLRLPDRVLPIGLTPGEEREACRALKGSMLRQEVYALDASDKQPFPYTVTEQSFSIYALQPIGANRHAVCFSHPGEMLTYHFERNPVDPRVQHSITLEVDAFGNVLKEAAIGYGRRPTVRVIDASGSTLQIPNPGLSALTPADQVKQTTVLATYTEHQVTNSIDAVDARRNPLPCETRTYELTGYVPTGQAGRFQVSDLVESDPNSPGRVRLKFIRELGYEVNATGEKLRRLLGCRRTLYRRDELTGLMPLGQVTALGLMGESYKLALTPGLLSVVYKRPRVDDVPESLIPIPAEVLAGQGGEQGGYVQSQIAKADGRFPGSDPDECWWLPSGRSFFSADAAEMPVAELAVARQHFFVPRRYRDPFGQDTIVNFDSADFLLVGTRDALGNTVTVDTNDYRVLQASLITDPNGNQTAVAFDLLGLVSGTAVMGKPAPAPFEGDSLESFVADLTPAQLDAFHDAADPTSILPTLLQNATTRIVYDVERFYRTSSSNPDDPSSWLPPYAATLARETHVSDRLASERLKIRVGISYSDGFGREIQKKVQAAPAPTGKDQPSPRWIASGWSIANNKGKPVRQYEPFFSASHRYEFGVTVGVSPVLFYDPVGRVIATLHPNNCYEKVLFDPWQQTTYDANDTVAQRNTQTGDPRTDDDIRGYVADYFSRVASGSHEPWQSWYQQRQGGALGSDEQLAATKAAAHSDTPATACFDVLGRTFLTIARNRVSCAGHPRDGTEEHLLTRVEFDIIGQEREIRDAVRQAGDGQGRVVMRYAYDMLGARICHFSMDAAARWSLNDVAGNPIRAWDSRGHNSVTAYDELRRPIRYTVRGTSLNSDPRLLNNDVVVERVVYGESQPSAEALNLRTRIFQHFDSAGLVTNVGVNPLKNAPESYDFKGNLLRSSRRFISDYASVPNWAQSPQLEDETFTHSTRYDAVNRPVLSVAPHSSLSRAEFRITQPVFNAANLLERVDVWLSQGAEPGTTLDSAANPPSAAGVLYIDYDAKGRRRRVDYKNAVSTVYHYDPLTFRLTQLVTQRDARAFPDDCPGEQPAGWPGCHVQRLSYTYDAVGNIARIQDDAQQTIYFRNRRVEPTSSYTYDAVYRLIEATGREHLGQGYAPVASSSDDSGRTGILSSDAAGRFSPGDGNAMGAYVERYVYDSVGNILQVQHRGGDHAPGWTRSYAYTDTSVIEDGGGTRSLETSNRLTSTTLSADSPTTHVYQHDNHGNMVRMPHLGGASRGSNMHWDFRDHLCRAELGGGGSAYYLYDAAGTRVRKVWEKAPGLTEDRLYLGGFEVFRRHPGRVGASTATLERETLHITDHERRVALVETRTVGAAGDDTAPALLIRYQFANHLMSASLELDDHANVISYEEYTPYGSTSYQAVRSQTETPKRYRYTGKERDEESGLDYHGARYYAAWIARWTSSDPAGLVDGPNVFRYARGNPVVLSDPNGKDPLDPANFATFQSFRDASPTPYSDEYLTKVWEATNGPMTPATPRSVTYSVARAEANAGAKAFRVQQGMVGSGPTVQAGHTIAARHVPESGISREAANAPETFMPLTSEHGQGMSATVTGHPDPLTPHSAQELVINASVDRARAAGGGVLTPEAHQAAGAEVRWQLQGTGFDQREADLKRASGLFDEAAAIEASPAVQARRAATASSLPEAASSQLAAERSLVSSEGSLMCESLGGALEGVNLYFAITGAQQAHKEGDTVGVVLNLSTIGPQGIVTGPLLGYYNGMKAGAQLMKMEVDCSAIGMAYEMRDISVDDRRLNYCMPLLSKQIQNDVYNELFNGL
jgi:RHS repeat-associated protein